MAVTNHVDQARQCALELLKPSEKDKQRGLELHRDAIVVESYGFGPGGNDPEKIIAAIRAGASGAELQDVIEDVAMTSYVRHPERLREFKELWDASGVTCVFRNAGEEGQDPMRLIRRLAHYMYVTDSLKDFLPKALTPADIRLAKREKRHCICLTCNGVPVSQDWFSIREELRYISLFYQLGCRMMHLTYNRRNMLADGCGETANGGLSDFGRSAIAEMNRVGVIVDVAHSGWQTSLEAAQVSKKPIVASHSTCAALQRHIRSKPDEVIKAIADGGGLVGICAIPAFLGRTGDINAMLDHIDYLAKKFGTDFIAIGTDVGASLSLSEQEKKLDADVAKEFPRTSRRNFEGLWAKDDPLFSPEWRKSEQTLSLAWTNFPLFTVGLVQRGYADDDIRKILGGNMLRVLDAVLPDADKNNAG
jgi:membrane dipeptidase